MALLSDLVTICADHRVDSEATLTLFARRLREAGRVSKAGRGRGAAKMTYLDAARFLIAVAATDHPERATDAEYVFSNLSMHHYHNATDFSISFSEDDQPTFDVGLAHYLEALSSGAHNEASVEKNGRRQVFRLMPEVWVDRSGGARIELFGAGSFVTYSHPLFIREIDTLLGRDADRDERAAEARADYERETYRFRSGKNLTATLKKELLRAVADAVAGNTPANVARQSAITAPGASAPGQLEGPRK